MATDDNRRSWQLRRFPRRAVLRGGVVTAAGLGIAACTNSAATPTPAPAAAVATPAAANAAPTAAVAASPTPALTAKYGGTLRLNGGRGQYPHMDPHQTSSSSLFGLGLGLAYNRLMKLRLEGVEMPAYLPVPDLADSFEQPDELTYIFKLKQGVKFHNVAPVNGREVVAADVAFSYDRQRALKVNGALLDGLIKTETPDKYTVKLTLANPDADFALAIAAPQSLVIAKEVVDLKGDLKEGPVIGTGGFVLESADLVKGIAFKKNPDYFVKGRPYIDRWELNWFDDATLSFGAAKTGQLDWYAVVEKGDLDALQKANPNIDSFIARGYGSGLEFALNLATKPLDDERVRQAIYKAIDVPELISGAFDGFGFYTVGMPLPGVDWAIPQDEMKQRYKRDLDGAKKLMSDAGLAAGFDLEIKVTNVMDQFVAAAELIQQRLKDINVRVTLKVIDFPTYSQIRQRGPYDAYIGSAATQVSASGGLGAKWRSGGELNSFGLKDPKLDQMIDDQRKLARDPAARKKLLLDIQRYILDHAYMRMIVSFEQRGLITKRVKNFIAGSGILNIEMDKWNLLWLDA